MGIAEALITTAGGMVVAVIALAVFRVCISLAAGQMDYFSDVGNELELIYRQHWYEPNVSKGDRAELTDERLVSRLVEVLQQLMPSAIPSEPVDECDQPYAHNSLVNGAMESL